MDNIDTLSKADHFLIDGTFKSAPNMFTQMLVVHGLLSDGWHMPLAYGLVPGKTQTLYINLLEELDAYGPFYSETVLCDYEQGLRNAIVNVWPGTTLRGCYFHHKQCLWRHLRNCDLIPEYNVIGSDIRKYFKMIGVKAFVHPIDIDTSWRRLKPLLPSYTFLKICIKRKRS